MKKKIFVFCMSLLLLAMVVQAAVDDEFTHNECDDLSTGWTHNQCDQWNGLVRDVGTLPSSEITHDESDSYGWTHDQADEWNGLIANGIPSSPAPVVPPVVPSGGITHDEADTLGITHDEADIINSGYPNSYPSTSYYYPWYGYYSWYYPRNCRFLTSPQCYDMGMSYQQCQQYNNQVRSYCYWYPYFWWW